MVYIKGKINIKLTIAFFLYRVEDNRKVKNMELLDNCFIELIHPFPFFWKRGVIVITDKYPTLSGFSRGIICFSTLHKDIAKIDAEEKAHTAALKMDKLVRLSDEHSEKMYRFLSDRLSERDLLEFQYMNNEFMCKTAHLK